MLVRQQHPQQRRVAAAAAQATPAGGSLPTQQRLLPLARPPSSRRRRAAVVVRAVAAPVGSGRSSPLTGQPADGGDECRFFVDRDGDIIRVMCCDWGFRSGAGRLYQDKYGEVPGNVLDLARDNFGHELAAMRRAFRGRDGGGSGGGDGDDEDVTGVPPFQPPANNPLAKLVGAAGGAASRGLGALDRWLEARRVLPPLAPQADAAAVAAAAAGDSGVGDECREIRLKLAQLRLDDAAVWAREERRKAAEGDVAAPWFVKVPFWLLCVLLDGLFANRPIQRFWVLETVARIPYFAYISILHLYESTGFWRAGADLRRVHFAEEWNELHHLQIMEALGGDQSWFDRFVAEHAALAYYWGLILMYLLSPRLAYAFSELVELHAADTYTGLVAQNEALLASLPPPMVAAAYYRNADLYMFDALQTCSLNSDGDSATGAAGGGGGAVTPRRPPCNTLLDVFVNIRDDENEHVATMHNCQNPQRIASDLGRVRSAGAAQRSLSSSSSSTSTSEASSGTAR